MSPLEVPAAADRFAAGEQVLVGDESDQAVFVAAAADRITSEGLSDLHELGRGAVVLGMSAASVERLRLHAPAGRATDDPLRIGVAIDAARRDGGGWSLSDRAHTIRVAARAESGPRDLLVPGHVLTARVEEHGVGAAAAALELARIAGPAQAVALTPLLDRRGSVARLSEALRSSRIRRVAHVSSAELRARAIARSTAELAVACELPTREGRFRAIAFAASHDAPATVALLHGDPAQHSDPFVHIHVACRLGDVFGSLLCQCRADLDAATREILRHGSGVVIYVPSPDPVQLSCSKGLDIDPGLIAGILRAVGVQSGATTQGVELPATATSRVEPSGLATARHDDLEAAA